MRKGYSCPASMFFLSPTIIIRTRTWTVDTASTDSLNRPTKLSLRIYFAQCFRNLNWPFDQTSFDWASGLWSLQGFFQSRSKTGLKEELRTAALPNKFNLFLFWRWSFTVITLLRWNPEAITAGNYFLRLYAGSHATSNEHEQLPLVAYAISRAATSGHLWLHWMHRFFRRWISICLLQPFASFQWDHSCRESKWFSHFAIPRIHKYSESLLTWDPFYTHSISGTLESPFHTRFYTHLNTHYYTRIRKHVLQKSRFEIKFFYQKTEDLKMKMKR